MQPNGTTIQCDWLLLDRERRSHGLALVKNDYEFKTEVAAGAA
jgi:hypothetical protein